MRASQRYAIVSGWSFDEQYDAALIAFIVETATIRDTKTGFEYRQGAYRVRPNVKGSGFRARTFYGETAWMRARNYADDCARQARYG